MFEFSGEGANRVCRAWARLAEDPEEIVEYVSPPFASITPKNSPRWKTDPDQQHAYYSGRALCRRHFPDVLLGVYADDELVAEPRGAETARDVTPPRGLSDRLDALAQRPPAADELARDLNVTDGFGGLGAYDAGDADGDGAFPGDEDESRGDADELQIDRASPDYALGWEGGASGLRKGLTSAIKSDPARLASYEAGFAAGQAHSQQED